MHERYYLDLSYWPNSLPSLAGKQTIGRQQAVDQVPSLRQPADRQMRFLDQHCHREIRQQRDEMRQGLEKPNRSHIESEDCSPVGELGQLGRADCG